MLKFECVKSSFNVKKERSIIRERGNEANPTYIIEAESVQ